MHTGSPKRVTTDAREINAWFERVERDRHLDRKPRPRTEPIGRPTGRAPRPATNSRQRGSRRTTAPTRGDPDDDPEPAGGRHQLELIPRARSWRLSDRREIAAWIAERLDELDRARGRRAA